MFDVDLLRAVELKGRVRAEDLTGPLACGPDDARRTLDLMVDRGLVAPAGRAFRLSPEGQRHVAQLLDRARAEADQVLLSAAYEDFCEVNGELKTIITAWQLLEDGSPNDHQDAAYDAAVLERLLGLHRRAAALLDRLAALSPRLERYPARLQHAADRIADGETTWVARPIMDSYHTVWFELHEDLIHLTGRTRKEEAAAGRAL